MWGNDFFFFLACQIIWEGTKGVMQRRSGVDPGKDKDSYTTQAMESGKTKVSLYLNLVFEGQVSTTFLLNGVLSLLFLTVFRALWGGFFQILITHKSTTARLPSFFLLLLSVTLLSPRVTSLSSSCGYGRSRRIIIGDRLRHRNPRVPSPTRHLASHPILTGIAWDHCTIHLSLSLSAHPVFPIYITFLFFFSKKFIYTVSN